MIEKNINENLVKKDTAAKILLTYLYDLDKEINFANSAIYHNFPIYPDLDSDDTIAANVIFASQEHGLFIFQAVESSNTIELIKSEEKILDDIDRLIFAKLLKESPNLIENRRRKTLKVNIRSILFLNNLSNSHLQIESDFDICSSFNDIKRIVTEERINLSDLEFKDLKATIEGSKGIPKPKNRSLKNSLDFKNSKGAILSAIENEIYNFDLEQKRAALFILDGPQRIRGLAGSGKTVILSMKAALIHLQNPDAEILYTYYTKSLNDIVKNLITRFYRQFADRDPNWKKINIMHAWGGKYLEGVYYNTCINNGISPIDLIRARASNKDQPFKYVCEELDSNSLKKQFDYCLIDEAQDFPNSFYRICRKITKKNRVVWAYDDFQNILNTDIQNERETFGKDSDGKYFIDFSRSDDKLQDLILHICYRNPRKILITAFALGLAIYNKGKDGVSSKIVQRLESNDHWESLGFKVNSGNSQDNSLMEIERPSHNSASIKNELLDEDDLILITKFDSFRQELDFIIKSIQEDVAQELKPEDITVVCMDNINVKKYFTYIQTKLFDQNINCFNLLNASNSNKFFKIPEHVTLSTIYNAKGNEAGKVYIVGIDAVFQEKNDITERNKIFTAMTRSLGWVTLTGVGDSVDYCINEIKKLKENNYKLIFKQPSENDVRTIRQGINTKQRLLNRIERLADEFVNETELSKEELVEQLKIKFFEKK
ncbi:ATP-binding domain-containing protein [Sphingobacterium faecium]|uniref:DEAD/DEAH box helicase n=1 Tax=Sphingobacterium faecium TaxID=34087 RepID=UPI00320835AD